MAKSKNVCPQCNGDKREMIPAWISRPKQKAFLGFKAIKCPACKGTGKRNSIWTAAQKKKILKELRKDAIVRISCKVSEWLMNHDFEFEGDWKTKRGDTKSMFHKSGVTVIVQREKI